VKAGSFFVLLNPSWSKNKSRDKSFGESDKIKSGEFSCQSNRQNHSIAADL